MPISITVLTVARADLATNLTSGEVRSVHVGIGQTCAHGLQGRIEVAYANALSCGSRNICGPTICMRNAPEPAVLIGGTSFSPTRLAEKSSVAERAAGTAKRLAASVAIAHMPIFRVFIDEFYRMGRAVVKLFRPRRAATS